MIMRHTNLSGTVSYFVVDSFAYLSDAKIVTTSIPGRNEVDQDIPGGYSLFTDNMKVITHITIPEKEDQQYKAVKNDDGSYSKVMICS